MRKCVQSLVAGLAAAALLAVLASAAAATRLEITSSSFRMVWSPLQIEPRVTEPFTCLTTLEGTFHEFTLRKVRYALMGYVTRARMEGCVNGRATVLAETLPWHLKYEGFTGRLPVIESITALLVGLAVRGSAGFITCLLRTTDEHHLGLSFPVTLEVNGKKNKIKTVNALGEIPTTGAFCEIEEPTRVTGEGILTPLNSTMQTILINLI